MADYRDVSETESLNSAVLAVVSRLRHCMPGYIQAYNGEKNLATVIPGIKMKISVRGEIKYETLPMVAKVPVSIPYSQKAGLCLTMPIRQGDECTILYSDRFIDDFVKRGTDNGKGAYPEMRGGDNETSEVRMFDETDAICLPGLISIPTAIPNWNNDAIELRNKDRTAFISLGVDSNITIQTQGNVTVNATGNVDVTGAQIHLN